MKYNETGVRNLASAMLLQAAEDYLDTKKPEKKEQIIKDLNSRWNRFFTNDMSIVVAEKLKTHPGQIKRNLKRYKYRRDS